MDDGRRRSAGDVRHRAPGYEPHHELDAFGTRLADIFNVRHLCEAFRICDQLVQEGVVPGGVDEAGAGALKLMAHAAGTPDLDVEILGVAPDRLTDRLA